MNYTLIISEKKEAAERIARALDDDGKPSKFQKRGIPYFEAYNNNRRLLVVPAIGHLYTIAPDRRGGFYYPIFSVKWTPAFLFDKKARHTKNWITAISEISEGASDFISGTDYDIEGEVIGYTICKYACNGKEEKAKRMIFSTLTTKELREAYKVATQGINFRLAEAGETRHIIDFLWGINLSRALTLAVKNACNYNARLSTGRVQAPALKFLVDREKEIKRFAPVPYWKIRAKIKIGRRLYDVEYEKQRIENENDAKSIVEKCLNSRGVISDIIIKTSKIMPPVPFDLGTLQRESYRLFKYSPSRTLRAAENLYLKALISYPRTSSQKIPLTIGYRKILSGLGFSKKYKTIINKLLSQTNLKPNEGSKQDSAHPAIYPTGNLPERRLESANRRIFDLVVRRFMAVFGTPAIKENIRISIKVRDELFYLKGSKILHKGWLEFYKPYERSKQIIPPLLNIGEEIIFSKAGYEIKHTLPPPRYNPSSMLRLLEDENIGTKATRAEIIDTLYNRGYITGERMVVTELGYKIVETLEKYCEKIVSVKFTRALEERMENIEKGKEKKGDILKDSVEKLRTILNQFKMNEEKIGMRLGDAVKKSHLDKLVVGQCPICKTGNLVVLSSRKTGKRFVGCTNFKKNLCNATFPLPQPPYEIQLKRKTCNICSWPIIAVRSKYKRFWRFWNLCLNPNCPTKKNRQENS